MADLASLPTNKDEAWRYSAVDRLAELAPEALADERVITVAAGEQVRETLLSAPGDGVHIERIKADVDEGGALELFCLADSASLARIEIEVTLASNAHFELGGITLGGGNSVREIVSRVIHAQPDATSNQVVRGVHWGQGTGNFLGSIDVVRDAQRTDAGQDFKGLLLEKGASCNAVPQLEIFADDVKCAHGASVGQLDEMARYYMAARGIAPDAAQALLVQAFIGDALVALQDEEARTALMDRALAKLEERV